MIRSTRLAFATLMVLACACTARADIRVGTTFSVHVDIFIWCITRTYEVTEVSSVGHMEGRVWMTFRLVSSSVNRHTTDSTATASDPNGLVPDLFMGFSEQTITGNTFIEAAMHEATIPQSRFDDPDDILSGDVSFQSPVGFGGIVVPGSLGMFHPYSNGFEPEFNFNPGDGFVMSDNDTEFTGVIDGNVFTPIPAPGAAASVALVATVGLARRRR